MSTSRSMGVAINILAKGERQGLPCARAPLDTFAEAAIDKESHLLAGELHPPHYSHPERRGPMPVPQVSV